MFIANIVCDRSVMNFHDNCSGHSNAKSATKTPRGHKRLAVALSLKAVVLYSIVGIFLEGYCYG